MVLLQRRDAVGMIRKSICFIRFGTFSVKYQKMQSVRIPALREAGAARLGTWETMVFLRFSNVSWSAPVIPLAVGRDHGRRQRRDAVGKNRKMLCFTTFLKLFQLNIRECSR